MTANQQLQARNQQVYEENKAVATKVRIDICR